MKNRAFIQALNRIGPSHNQKEKMLNSILQRKEKKNISWNWTWKYGLAIFCLCFLITGDVFYQNEPSPMSIHGRSLPVEDYSLFYYQDHWYQQVEVIDPDSSLVFLENIFDEEMRKNVNIYQGKTKDLIILNFDNTYFLYQKIER